jgi:hypothetical protein
MKKFTIIPATYEEAERIKAENRAKKIALIATISEEDRAAINKWAQEVAVRDFSGYRSLDSD